MLTVLFSFIKGESLFRCFLSILYFHKECYGYLHDKCFKEDNNDPRSLVLMYLVDNYISLFRNIRFTAVFSRVLEVFDCVVMHCRLMSLTVIYEVRIYRWNC